MKQLIIVFISILCLSSCNAQKNNAIMQLDIESFESKKYYLEDSTLIDQYTFTDQFYKKTTRKNGKVLTLGSKAIHKWYEYDEKGNITKVTDYDLGFSFTLDSLQAYAKRNEIDLLKTRISTRARSNTWILDYSGKYRERPGAFIITLDGKTGKELLVTQKSGIHVIEGTTVAVSVYDTIYYKGQPYQQKVSGLP